MTEILIISHYYPPEMGAASNRIYQLANGLKNDFLVTVLTPLPNYPEGKIFEEYSGRFKNYTKENGVSIKRLWIYPSNSKNKLIRLVSMLSYSLSLFIYFIFNSVPNRVIIQSPPLIVAFTSVLFLRSKKRKLILNVSDLWPDAGLDLGALKQNRFYSLLKKIEAFNYKNSQLILGQSQEILNHVSNITDKPKLLLYRNYAKIDFKPQRSSSRVNPNKIKLVYAGLIGVAQGIVKLCEELDYSGIEFHIYGSGPESMSLKKFINENEHLSIYYYGNTSREKLHGELLKYDVAIIPLVKRIYGSVPSKIFELAALGMPVLYFGGGEGESIVEKNNLGWVVSPKKYSQLNSIIQNKVKPELENMNREIIKETAKHKFSFEKQIQSLKIELS